MNLQLFCAFNTENNGTSKSGIYNYKRSLFSVTVLRCMNAVFVLVAESNVITQRFSRFQTCLVRLVINMSNTCSCS